MREKSAKKIKFSAAVLTALVFGSFLLLVAFLPREIEFWATLIAIGVAAICVVARIFWGKKFPSQALLLLLPFAFIMLFWQTVRGFEYTFLDGAFIPFWLPSLICALLVVMPLTVWLAYKKIGLWWCVAFVLIVGGVTFFIANGFANNLNYVCDTSAPVQYEGVILKKNMNLNPRGPDSYSFMMNMDGENVFVEVSSSMFWECEVGDTFSVAKYQGAFDKPFYLAK